MKNKLRLTLALTVIASLNLVQAGEITGTVSLKGTPAPEKELPIDANCGKLHTGAKPKTRFYAAAPGGGLADVVVSLKGVTGKSTGASAKPAVLDQVGCEYTPYILGIQTGQKLLAKNSDPLMHNVHPTPDPKTGNPESNKAQLPKGPDIEYTFKNPENFLRFKCDVHPWMFAYVTVFDHPYFAVTGKDGTFKIADVPPGKYTLEIAHRKGGIQTKEIEVKSEPVKADFTIEAK